MNKRLFMFSLRFIIIGIVQTLCWNSHSTWHHSPSSIAPLEKLFLFPQNHTKQTHTANAPENKPTTFPTRRTLVPFPSFDFFSFKRTIFPTAQYLPTSFHPQSLTVAQPSQPNTHKHTHPHLTNDLPAFPPERRKNRFATLWFTVSAPSCHSLVLRRRRRTFRLMQVTTTTATSGRRSSRPWARSVRLPG